MDEIKKFRVFLYLSMGMITLGSLFLLVVPLADFRGTAMQKTAGYAAGAGFWIFLLTGYVLFYLAEKQRKKLMPKEDSAKAKAGIFSFFQTRAGAVSDISSVIALAGTMFTLFTSEKADWISVVFIFFLFLSLQMHCILNGKNFIYENSISLRSAKK